MSTGIYAYWDNENNYYAYVGKDSNLDKKTRHKAHLNPSRYDEQPFNRILQNNFDRYEYRVLMKGDYSDKQLNKMEKFLIKHLKTFKYDYPDRSVFNFTKGGDGMSGIIMSEETKKKISKANSGENHWNYGKTLSYEIKKKISEVNKGRVLSEENKINRSKSNNTTGFFRVTKKKKKDCKQGFIWCYAYYDGGKRKYIQSVSLEKLKQKVKTKGLEWRVI